MIPLIEKEVVERRGWVKSKELTDMFALAQSLPGAIAINSATFVGYRLAGVAGATVATIGVLLPTLIIVVAVGAFFLKVQHHPKVEAAFISIRATVVALITYAAIRIGKEAIVDKASLAIIVLTVLGLLFTPIHPVILLTAGGITGIVLVRLRGGIIIKKQRKTPKQHMEEHPDYYLGGGI